MAKMTNRKEEGQSEYRDIRIINESVYILIAIFLVVILIAISFSQFKKENRESVRIRNEEYIKDFTLSLAEKLNEQFATAQVSVAALADMMEGTLVVNDNLHDILANLEAETQFDHVRYVDARGYSHTSKGTVADVSDRQYFIEGMKGNSGTTYVTDSRLTNQRQIGFYAPVMKFGEPRGVMVVFYDEETLSKSIDYWFYGEKSSAGIITTEGQMIVNSPSDYLRKVYKNDSSEDICNLIQSEKIDEETRQKVIEAYSNKTETAFEINADGNEVIGYLAPLDSVDLNVYMTFPHNASKEMFEDGIAAGSKLQTHLIIIFVVFALFVMAVGVLRISQEKKKSRLFSKRANTDELTGLGNRRAYDSELKSYENQSLPEDLVYVSFDVNGLKNVNDTVGHFAGDRLIIDAAECLKECFGEYGKVFRTGGDEFVAILHVDEKQLEILKRNFEALVSRYSKENEERLNISCGYVVQEEASTHTLKEMSLIADKRMYVAKAAFYQQKNLDRRNKI